MVGMFAEASNFNQPLYNWNTSLVTGMSWMFLDASNFNQDLRSWCVPSLTVEPGGFASNSPLESSGLEPIWGTCP